GCCWASARWGARAGSCSAGGGGRTRAAARARARAGWPDRGAGRGAAARRAKTSRPGGGWAPPRWRRWWERNTERDIGDAKQRQGREGCGAGPRGPAPGGTRPADENRQGREDPAALQLEAWHGKLELRRKT